MKFQTKALLGIGAAVGAYFVRRSLLQRSRQFPYANKVAIVTGGSRGLGLEITRQLVERGVRVAICSRTERDIDTALEEFGPYSSHVLGMVCDIRDRQQVQGFIEWVQAAWGDVDLLFNVAGIMEVGPLESMTIDDFQESMDINCWGALHMILAVLPLMRRKRWGRIVNVASIGGKQAVPHMLPYDASKHALVGLSNGLRAELAQQGILVTTACPTLMRTGSPRNATFKGQHRAEYAWFSIGGSLPLLSLDSHSAAARILQACQNGDGEVFIANFLNPAVWATRFAPELTADLLALVNRWLPGMGGIGQAAAFGRDSESPYAPSWLTQAGDNAAWRNNEMNQPPEYPLPPKG